MLRNRSHVNERVHRAAARPPRAVRTRSLPGVQPGRESRGRQRALRLVGPPPARGGARVGRGDRSDSVFRSRGAKAIIGCRSRGGVRGQWLNQKNTPQAR